MLKLVVIDHNYLLLELTQMNKYDWCDKDNYIWENLW